MTTKELQLEIRSRLNGIELSLREARELLVGHLKVGDLLVMDNMDWHLRRDKECKIIADKLNETRSEFYKLKSLIESTTNKFSGAKTIIAWAILGLFGISGTVLGAIDLIERIKGW